MQLEVRFTIREREMKSHSPWSRVEPKMIYTFFLNAREQYRYPILNEDGILKLRDGNPFEEPMLSFEGA
jgi:hypothetical protein